MLTQLWNSVWKICARWPAVRRRVTRSWYEFVAVADRGGDVRFMNYGYAEPEAMDGIAFAPGDESNRYQIQLYHRVACQVNLSNLDVLEVGSGRGGGAAYVCVNLKPRQLTGVDISPRAVQFCTTRYPLSKLQFMVGDAENLDFPDQAFDVVLNIESSSHYGSVQRFLCEVARVLRPQGHLLFADIREPHEIPELLDQFRSVGLTICNLEDITPGVLRALELDEERKTDLMKRKFPTLLHGAIKEFAGVRGSENYRAFHSGWHRYLMCMLRRECS